MHCMIQTESKYIYNVIKIQLFLINAVFKLSIQRILKKYDASRFRKKYKAAQLFSTLIIIKGFSSKSAYYNYLFRLE